MAIINGGPNEESNLTVTCGWCLPEKNAEDVAEKAKTAAVRKKHLGIRPAGKKLQGRKFDPAPAQKTASRPLKKRVNIRSE